MLETGQVAKLFDSVEDKVILVIGDLMLDEYIWGNVEKISPEAPVPIISVTRSSSTLGGAGNVLKNLVSLGSQALISSILSDDNTGNKILEKIDHLGVSSEGIFFEEGHKSTRKTRFYSELEKQQLIRVDNEDTEFVSDKARENIIKFVKSKIDKIDVIILSDYFKGVLDPKTISQVIELSKENDKPVIVDPKGKDFSKYNGCSVITPNYKELSVALGSKKLSLSELCANSSILFSLVDSNSILITLGKDGMLLLYKDGKYQHINSVAKEVFDVTGAGDTVVSVLAICMSLGFTIFDAARISNEAAGLVVSKSGTATLSKNELVGEIGNNFNLPKYKIKKLNELSSFTAEIKARNKKIVFTNGCFDIFHVGHAHVLRKAKEFGDILIVGINSDKSVRRLKGDKRPINSELLRSQLVAELDFVNYVVIFEESTPLKLIKQIIPDVLVKGGNYSVDEIVGSEIVEKNGGLVKTIDVVEEVSSTDIINNILDAYR